MFYFFEFMQVEGINYSQRVPSEMLTELQAVPSEMLTELQAEPQMNPVVHWASLA